MSLDFIPIWANAIAQQEGFGIPGNRPTRNHNPGDLKYAGQAGVIGADAGGFAVFPDDQTGFQALDNQLIKYVNDYPGATLLDISAHYLGQPTPRADSQGNAFTYAAAVATALGVDPSTTLGELVSGVQPAAPIPPELSADSTGGTTVVMASDGSLQAITAPPDSSSALIIAGVIGLAVFLWFWGQG